MIVTVDQIWSVLLFAPNFQKQIFRCHRFDWDFLAPWCAALKRHVDFGTLEVKEGLWEERKFNVQVLLPRRAFFDSDIDFDRTFHQVRDALKLIAAAATVEKSAFRYLLKKFCGVSFGKIREPKFEQEVQITYLVILDLEEHSSGDFDLVKLCGPEQRKFAGRSYEAAMANIATRNDALAPGRPGVEVKIPVQVFLTLNLDIIYPQEAAEMMWQLVSMAHCEKTIQNAWQQYNKSRGPPTVKPNMMRCTLVLKLAKKKQRVTRCGLSQCGSAIYNLGKLMLIKIFGFVAQPAQRQVFFIERQPLAMLPWLQEGGVQFVG